MRILDGFLYFSYSFGSVSLWKKPGISVAELKRQKQDADRGFARTNMQAEFEGKRIPGAVFLDLVCAQS